MRQLKFLFVMILLTGLALSLPAPVLAQQGLPGGSLSISTDYPSQVIGIGEAVTLDVKVHSAAAEVVSLDVAKLPKGWTAEFHGGGRLIHSVYVGQDSSSDVQLRVTPPSDVAAGTYDFTIVAKGSGGQAEFPVEFTVKEKLPPKLSFETDFATLKGGPDSPFNFSATLKNDGDEDITVTLQTDASKDFSVSFRSEGKDVTNLPIDIKAGTSQLISVTAEPITTLQAGSYPFTVTAQGDSANADISFTAEVAGQSQLTITTPDGRLSGDAYIGKGNPIKLVLHNSGSASALGVKLSSSSPSGWTVTLDPKEVAEVPAGGDVEVNATIKPDNNAVAGDYMITFTAEPTGSSIKSADFRITVRTSTIWGIAGIALIAVAVGVVGMAVMRFGRR